MLTRPYRIIARFFGSRHFSDNLTRTFRASSPRVNHVAWRCVVEVQS